MTSCLVLIPTVCVRFSDDFAVWEIVATALVSGVVTAVTIWFATKSARTATQQALDQSEREHREALDQADRSSKWQSRMQEVVAMREMLYRYYWWKEHTNIAGSDDRYQEARFRAETLTKMSLNPAADDLFLVIRDGLERSTLPKPGESTTSGVGRRMVAESQLNDLMERWGDDPAAQEASLRQSADAIRARNREMADTIMAAALDRLADSGS